MDIEKAKLLSVLVGKYNRYKNILKAMESGYSDEWEFRNSHTNEKANFSCDDWAEIRTMVQREFDEVSEEINNF
jgi:hypothetical protein